MSFEKNVKFRVYAYSTLNSASVTIEVGDTKCKFNNDSGNGCVATKGLTSNIIDAEVFIGTTDTTINITTGGNNSGDVEVYVYLVII